jgi:hypothetical protein
MREEVTNIAQANPKHARFEKASQETALKMDRLGALGSGFMVVVS